MSPIPQKSLRKIPVQNLYFLSKLYLSAAESSILIENQKIPKKFSLKKRIFSFCVVYYYG